MGAFVPFGQGAGSDIMLHSPIFQIDAYVPFWNLYRKTIKKKFREAGKKINGESTKRGDGVRGCPKEKKNFFNVYFLVCSRSVDN